jgi:DNA helicase-2/ATP-dependent DNA helicase PcrA
VDAANRIMHGRAGALELRAAPDAAAGPAPSVSAFPNDRAEARAIADAIRSQIDGGAQPASIAILYRINVQSAVLESALGDAGVPFVIRGATRFFDQREVKEAIMLLKGASVNTAPEPLFQTVSDVLRSLGWTQEPPAVRGAVRDRWESLNALMGLVDEAPEGTSLKEFVAELIERQAGQHEPPMSAVTLATLHSAKGLEWDCVYIAGVSEGLLPIGYARTELAVEEERRLFYVGVTRARRQLRLSWAGPNREPSRFLADLR